MPNPRPIEFPSAVGLKLGDTGEGVDELQHYLSRFGYLDRQDAGDYADLFATAALPQFASGKYDRATFEALQQYQRFNGLPPTGELDDPTVAHMSMPRCGFPDVQPNP